MLEKVYANKTGKIVLTVIRIVLIMTVIIYLWICGGPQVLGRDWVNHSASTPVLLDLCGRVIKLLDLKDIYNDSNIYITDDMYIMSPNNETSADYETEQMDKLKKYLDEKGMDLVYVNLPTKYIDDSIFAESFGKRTYSNKNADVFLERISEKGIKTLDLRDDIRNENMDVYGLFFRTDHHWTPQTALWAAGKISSYLNENCGYDIDMDLYDPSNYSYTTYKECWTGEQGRKISSVYIGHDDFTSVKPDFPTSFDFGTASDKTGFDGFFEEPVKDIYKDPDSHASWHNLYKKRSVKNKNVDHGKILLVCDSYSNSLEPFLAVGVSEIDLIVLRESEQNLIEFIGEKEYDTVLICYAQFMIGAHDDPDSANYSMFRFF